MHIRTSRLKYSGEQIVPEAFDLHIFITDQPEIDQHIKPYKQLNYTPGVLVFLYEQEYPKGYGQSNIAEIEEIEQVVFCEPQGYCNRFKNDKYNNRINVFSDLFHNCLLVSLPDCYAISAACFFFSLYMLLYASTAFSAVFYESTAFLYNSDNAGIHLSAQKTVPDAWKM